MLTALEERIGFIVAVKVQISPTFWDWLFQFGKQMHVVSPEMAVKKQRERIEELMG